jgi:hypothetical protein
MAHYAFLDENNIVTEVIVGKDETETIDNLSPEEWYGNFKNQPCKRTSYNAKIRGNYAGIGFSYMADLDIFMPPKCHESATLDAKLAKWICSDPSHEPKELNANN